MRNGFCPSTVRPPLGDHSKPFREFPDESYKKHYPTNKQGLSHPGANHCPFGCERVVPRTYTGKWRRLGHNPDCFSVRRTSIASVCRLGLSTSASTPPPPSTTAFAHIPRAFQKVVFGGGGCWHVPALLLYLLKPGCGSTNPRAAATCWWHLGGNRFRGPF